MSSSNKVGVVILALFSLWIARALYLHFSINSLLLKIDDSENIYMLSDDNKIIIERKKYRKFITKMLNADSIWSTGNDSSEWSHMCSINLAISDSPVYQLSISRGRGIKRFKTIANMRRVTEFGEYYYSSLYVNKGALAILNEITDSKCAINV